jgi:hypothetical protein
MTNRPDIPEPMKRQVRQECFFGCVLCGSPVFHYDHIQEYSVVKEHTVGNIALLCEMHHGAKTTGKLSADRVAEARLAPFNKDRALTPPYRIEPNREIEILLGTNRFTAPAFNHNKGTAHGSVWVNGKWFLILNQEMGWLSISAAFTDSEGQVFLEIDQGEIRFSPEVWDYRYEGTRLQVRQGLGEYLLDLDLSNTAFHLHTGCFFASKGNGYAVVDGFVYGVVSGRTREAISGGTYAGGSGDIGMLTSSAPPGIVVPKGFGSFTSFSG